MLLMSDEKDVLDEYFERLCEEIPEEEQDLVQRYVDTLDDDRMLVLETAASNLGTSFDITKSIGYIKWKASLK